MVLQANRSHFTEIQCNMDVKVNRSDFTIITKDQTNISVMLENKTHKKMKLGGKGEGGSEAASIM